MNYYLIFAYAIRLLVKLLIRIEAYDRLNNLQYSALDINRIRVRANYIPFLKVKLI